MIITLCPVQIIRNSPGRSGRTWEREKVNNDIQKRTTIKVIISHRKITVLYLKLFIIMEAKSNNLISNQQFHVL